MIRSAFVDRRLDGGASDVEDDGLDDDDGDVSLPLRVATPFFRFPTFLLPTALVVASDETALCARDASQSS